MKYLVAQIVGAALLVLGGQGGIRLITNENDLGFLAVLPGDVSMKIGLYVAIAVAGGYLAAWGYKQGKKTKK